MKAIFKREVHSCYHGMIGYVVAAVMLAFIGLYYLNYNLITAAPDFGYVLYAASMVMLFVIPAITMRSFAEERRSKTDQLLLTAPVTIPEIVLGKFLAQAVVFMLPLLVAAVMPLILTAFGQVLLKGAYFSLLGFILLGLACIAVGTWISVLMENQILAFLATFALLLVCYLMNGIRSMFTSGSSLAFLVFAGVLFVASVLVGVICKSILHGGAVFAVGMVILFVLFRLRPTWLLNAFNSVLSALALFEPFTGIVSGMFSINDVVYYLSVMVVFLFLTGQTLERRRWN